MFILERPGDAGSVDSLAFTPDGGRVLAGAPGGSVNCWTVDGRHVWARSVEYGAYGLAVSSDGEYLFVTGYGLEVFRVADGSAVGHPVTGPCHALAAGPDRRVVYAVRGPRVLLAGGSFPPAAPSDGWALATGVAPLRLAFLPGGGRFVEVSAGLRPPVAVTVRDAATGGPVRSLPGPPIGTADQVAAGGHWVAVRSTSSVFVWDLGDPDGPPVRLTTGSRKHFTGVAFHPSGEFLTATANDNAARVYRVGSWGLARAFDWKVGRLRSVAFSPDGTLAAAGGRGRVVVWDFDA